MHDTYIAAHVWHIGLNAQKCPCSLVLLNFFWFCRFHWVSPVLWVPLVPWWFCALLVPLVIILIPCFVRSSDSLPQYPWFVSYYNNIILHAGSLSSLCFPGSLSISACFFSCRLFLSSAGFLAGPAALYPCRGIQWDRKTIWGQWNNICIVFLVDPVLWSAYHHPVRQTKDTTKTELIHKCCYDN